MQRNYKNIEVWQLADNLAVEVYLVTKNFPKEELYGLVSQMRRAAVSVPANIAEGASRDSKKEYLHFLYISRGSLSELGYYIHLAHRLLYIDESTHNHLFELQDKTARKLFYLIKAVSKEIC